METFKIGNKVNGIIRTYHSGFIGKEQLQYDNQPYTIFNGSNAQFTFGDTNVTINQSFAQLGYTNEKLTRITVSDIKLTTKILNLIFQKSEEKLCSRAENFNSNSSNQIFLKKPANEIYQVFIYNNEGQLEKAYGTLSESIIIVDKPNSNYLICYSYLGKESYSFDSPAGGALTLDLYFEGNTNDQTQDMYIHIEKCNLRVNKSLYFRQDSNTVDLVFEVLDTGHNYIVVK